MKSSMVGLGLVVAAGGVWAEPELGDVPYGIIFESHVDGNWELCRVNADGSGLTNLTQTPDLHELYPHVSPDGAKVSFVVDQDEGDEKTRSVWIMNLDGSGRTKVADNARQACWGPGGSELAYLKGEYDKFTYTDYATRELMIYNLATGEHRKHPNDKLHHLYNICWSPDGNWFVATVHGGMGYDHAILAIEGNGLGVFDLGIGGCRPDLSPDGKRIAWGPGDYALAVADIDFGLAEPKVTNRRDVVTSEKPLKIYHIDWSPDGKWVAFSRGPTKKNLGPAVEIVGVVAPEWELCVADAAGTNEWKPITNSGGSSKEPDWIPLEAAQ